MKSALKVILTALIMGLGLGINPLMAQGQNPDTYDQTQLDRRLPEDEIIYFLMTDRFENGDKRNDKGFIKGDVTKHGFDPTRKTTWHGGDIKGLINRLGYIKSLGATAIWITPPFVNKPVANGDPDKMYTGFHGYHGLDFTDIDPHLGTRSDFAQLIQKAHELGLKVYVDIVINHTADVIAYKECADRFCPYRSKGDFPSLKGKTPYTPFVKTNEPHKKAPDWMNDISLYHNRGESLFEGESSQYGDFTGLDDLDTDNPKVVQGFIELYGQWIKDFGFDGYRIDTARHVQPSFWKQFIPQMKAIALEANRPNFHIFGEVYDPDPAILASHTIVGGYDYVIDFAFQDVLLGLSAKNWGGDRYARLIQADSVYKNADDTVKRQPIFTGNHDMGRLSTLIRQAMPKISKSELYSRVKMGHELMFFSRGVPSLYYGDEQGFIGDGHDNDAREDMMASQVAIYNDNDLIMNQATTKDDNFQTSTRLFQDFATLASLRKAHRALRYGSTTIVHQSSKPGLFAFVRQSSDESLLVIINNDPIAHQGALALPEGFMASDPIYGEPIIMSPTTGALTLKLAGLSTAVIRLKTISP